MSGSRRREIAPDARVPVWDAVVRLSHWLLAALVLFDVVLDDGGWLHRVAGYCAVGVVVGRTAWAGVAAGHGGLAALKPSLPRTLAYLRGRAPRTIGHDPLGLWMVWVLWTLVLLLGLTGWMSRLDAFWGDETVHAVHAWLADALLAGVGLHVAGVAVMGRRWRENLVVAMVTGRKRALDKQEPASGTSESTNRSALAVEADRADQPD